MVSVLLVVALLLTMLPMEVFAAALPVPEMVQDALPKEQMKPAEGAPEPQSVSEPVAQSNYDHTLDNGAVLHFDDTTGTITGCELNDATEIVIPAKINGVKVTAIGELAFSYSDLTSIDIPPTVISLGDSAFSYCQNLTMLTLPDGLRTIGKYAFENSGLTSIKIPSSLTMWEYAFASCKALTTVTLPDNLQTIPECAFLASGLTMVTLPDGLQTIGQNAFSASGLTSISIPASLVTWGDGAFSGCKALTTVTLPDNLQTIGVAAFLGSGLTSVNIPASVTTWGEFSFAQCDALTMVTLQDGLQTIGFKAFESSGLTSIDIPSSVTTWGEYAFTGCKALTTVTLQDGLQMIGEGAFDSSGLTSIDIPSSVTIINVNAFSGCEALTTVTLHEGLKMIGVCAFQGSGLTSIDIPASVMTWDSAFSGCKALTTATLPEDLKTIPQYAFRDSGLTSIDIPPSVTTIDVGAFSGCEALKMITLPEGLKTLEQYAFQGSGLTSIEIPASVSVIEHFTFAECEMLTMITLPEGLKTIGQYAFRSSGLASIDIPSTVTMLSDGAFSSCRALTTVTMPEGMTEIGSNTFSDCSSLTKMIIPASVESVYPRAFWNCNNLESVYILGRDTEFYTRLTTDRHFSEGSSVTIYGYPGSGAESMANNQGLAFIPIGGGRTLSVTVQTPGEEILTDGFSVIWYDEDNNLVGDSAELLGAVEEKTYYVEVVLGKDLAAQYQQPKRQTILPEDPGEVTIKLTPIATLLLTGMVQNKEKTPLAGVEITATYNGLEIPVMTDAEGRFQIAVPHTVVAMAIRSDGYYSLREMVDLTEEAKEIYDLGVYTLIEVVTDRIALNIVQRQAAEPGNEPMEITLSSASMLQVDLTRRGQPITSFEVQGMSVIFKPDVVSAGDQLTVMISDPRGEYIPSEPITTTLNEDKVGVTDVITLIQKGSFVLDGLTGPEAMLMVFDSTGKNVFSGAANVNVACKPMDAGNYSVVLMQRTSLLQSVPELGQFADLGLTEGVDYLIVPVTVRDGVITRLAECHVPMLDVAKLGYTVPEETSVMVYGKSSTMPQGTLFTLRVAYALNPAKNAIAETLSIVLPEDIVCEGTVCYVDDERTPFAYDAATRTVRIRLAEKRSAVAYLSCSTTESAGDQPVNAYLSLSGGITQPIGTAIVTVENASINVSTRTSTKRNIASGTTAAHSKVTLYDNDIQVAQTWANAAGSWSTEFNLVEPLYTYSYHSLYVVVESEKFTKQVVSDTVTIVYDMRMPMLHRITMYNTDYLGAGWETVFDYTRHSTEVPFYDYSGSHPRFTFKAELSGPMPAVVVVVTENASGDVTYVETAYDEESGAWIGSHDYTNFEDLPVSVYAVYDMDYTNTIPIDEDEESDLKNACIEAQEEILKNLPEILEKTIQIDNLNSSENAISGTVIYTDPETKEKSSAGTFQVTVEDIESTVTEETLENDGFTNVADSYISDEIIPAQQKGKIWNKYEALNDGQEIVTIVDLASGKKIVEVTIPTSPNPQMNIGLIRTASAFSSRASQENVAKGFALWVGGFAASLVLGGVIAVVGAPVGITAAAALGIGSAAVFLTTSIYNLYNDVKERGNAALDIKNRLEGHIDDLCDRRDELKEILNDCLSIQCCDESRKISKEKEKALREEIDEASVRMRAFFELSENLISSYGFIFQRNVIGSLVMNWVSVADELKSFDILQGAAVSITADELVNVHRVIDEAYNKVLLYIDTVKQDIWNAVDGPCPDLTCDEEQPSDEKNSLESQFSDVAPSKKPVTPILDPSGFVYEAVPSNRLSDVTATISYQDSSGTVVWDAENYNQINPQVTGASGVYQWDVPQGKWIVNFSKEGYEPADTKNVPQAEDGWLPVPPPQLNIHVGMISTAAPTVSATVAYTDRAEIKFSQYMQIESVQNAVVLIVNGVPVEVNVIALDAEYDLAEEHQYATRFALIPADGSKLANGIVVTVQGTALNYAGRPIGAEFVSSAMTATVRPTGINAPETVSIGVHETVNITFTLLPGVGGQSIIVESLSPGLLEVITEEVTTNSAGTATIKLVANMPGSAVVRLTEPVSGVSTEIVVYMSYEKSIAPVTVWTSDGTEVTSGMTLPWGTAIVLRTATEGASIRYTTNDTCPCKELALTYTEPIILYEDTILRAAAWKDGVYSATIRLDLTVSQRVPGGDTVIPTPTPTQKPTPTPTPTPNPSQATSPTPATYPISVEKDPEHGSIKLEGKSEVIAGEKVIFTVTPDEGYQIAEVKVVDKNGKEIEVKALGDGKYQFVMPESPVSVTVSFEPIPHTCLAKTFTDLDVTQWYHEAVDYVLANDLMKGIGDDKFAPLQTTDRAMLTTILYNLEERPEVAGASTFEDVAAGKWYADPIAWAQANHVVAGTSETTFAPEMQITREQMAMMLYNYALLKGYDVSNTGDLDAFVDAEQVSDWAETAMCWATANGLMHGVSADTSVQILKPQGDSTRVEMAALIMNFLETFVAAETAE